MSKPHLVMYCHYYCPDVASTAQIYTELAEFLSSEFAVTVVCAVPSYTGQIEQRYLDRAWFEESLNGVRVIRVRVPPFSKDSKLSRVRNLLAYFLGARSATRRVGRADVVFACSQPPILGGMLGVYGKRMTGGKLVFNIQDFNPEQTMAIAYAGGRVVHALMMALDKRSCRAADLVLLVGRDMQETLERRFRNEVVPPSLVINNWIDEHDVRPLAKDHPEVMKFRELHGLQGKYVIMYSGNIGLYYDLENLVRVFSAYRNRADVAFAFVGDGAIRSQLEGLCTSQGFSNAFFIPYQDRANLVYSLNAADVHLVANAKGIKGVSVPSKIYGVLATNLPILGVLEPGSEAWRIIEDSESGVLAVAGDYSSVADRLQEILSDPRDFAVRHSTGRAYLEQHFTAEASLSRYRDALIGTGA